MTGNVTQKGHCKDKKISVELAHHLFYGDIGVTLSFLCGVITMNLFTGRQARPQASINSLKWLWVAQFWLFISLFCLSSASYADLIYAANNDNTVSVVDTSTDKTIAVIPVGNSPTELVANSSGTQVYVATGGGVNVIDTSSNQVVKNIATQKQVDYLAINKAGTFVYAAGSRIVTVIDAKINEVEATLPTAKDITGLAINPASSKLVYVADGGGIRAIDSSNKVNTVIEATGNTTIAKMVVNSAGTRIYAINPYYNGLVSNDFGDGNGNISVIDTSTNKIIKTIPLGQYPTGIAINPSGTFVYVINLGDGTVSVIDTGTNSVIGRIRDKYPNYMFPLSIVVAPSGTYAYMSNSDSISVVDTSTHQILREIPVNNHGHGIAIISEAGATYPVTLSKIGTGSGSISIMGSGNYVVGETVNLTATPDSTSTFEGWSPLPCNSSFQMPSNGLICTATFSRIACNYSLNPSSRNHTTNTETGSVTVSPSSDSCKWTASSNVSWASISSGASGTGNGTVTYMVQANTTSNKRTGTLNIAGQTFNLIQDKINSTVLPVNGTPVSELIIYDQVMKKFMEERNIKAGVLVVMKDGVVMLEHGYGWKDKTFQTPLQPNAMFRLASIVKPITAAAILKLIGEGKIRARDKVFCVSNATSPCHLTITPFGTPDVRLKDITIQDLLDHKGGWNRDISGDPMFKSIEIANVLGIASPPNKQDITRYMMGRPLEHTPGTSYAYSNFGYMLLGLIIEKITGQTYTAYIQDNIFNPIGVADSEIELGHTLPEHRNPREPWYSDPLYNGGPNVFSPLEIVPWPDGGWYLEAMDSHGGMISTARAMAKFLQTYWISGNPRTGNGQTWWFYGSLDGTHTIAYQRPDGINLVALFNQRSDSSGLDYSAIKSELDVATNNVNWKIVDNSTSYLRVISWAETLYPELFPIRGKQEFTLLPYQVSYYPVTGTYIGYKPDDHNFYGYNPNLWGDNILFLGTLNEYLSSAQAAGF